MSTSYRPADAERDQLAQCIALALLLHILLVLVLGNTPGGTARLGEGVWGTLNVTLRGGRAEPDSGTPTPPPAAEMGPTGNAPQERFGGAVRSNAERPPQPDTPGATKLGTWNATHGDNVDGTVENPAKDATPPMPATVEPLSRATPAPPLIVAPKPAPSPPIMPASPLPIDSKPIDTPPLSATPTAPAPPTPPPVERANPEPSTVNAVPAVPTPAPAPPDVPIPAVVPAATQAPVAVPGPTPSPATVVAPVPPPAPIPIPVPAPAPVPVPAPAPVPVPTAPPAPTPRSEAIETPPIPPSAVAPAPESVPAAVMPERAPIAAPERRPASTSTSPSDAPQVSAPPEPALPRPGSGAPDAGSHTGQDVATPPSAPPGLPRLNLDLPRSRGGELSSRGSRGLLPLLPQPPDHKNKLAEGLEKAVKEDCRTAYAGLGPLAVVPLAIDGVREKGCRW